MVDARDHKDVNSGFNVQNEVVDVFNRVQLLPSSKFLVVVGVSRQTKSPA
jgi:hypothetical protein